MKVALIPPKISHPGEHFVPSQRVIAFGNERRVSGVASFARRQINIYILRINI
jgi:hypothetical protein